MPASIVIEIFACLQIYYRRVGRVIPQKVTSNLCLKMLRLSCRPCQEEDQCTCVKHTQREQKHPRFSKTLRVWDVDIGREEAVKSSATL